MKKKYSVKESLNMLSEFREVSTSDNLFFINDFLKSKDIIINIENNSKYSYLSFKEVLLVCFLLEEVKKMQLNESVNIKNSIKKEFSLLFEQKTLEEFSVYKFANYLRALTQRIKDPIIKPSWEKNIFTCDYFTMEKLESTRESSVPEVVVNIDENFEKLVCDSALIKISAGFYFEDVLLYNYSKNKNFQDNPVKQKIAYIVTILLDYNSKYNKMSFYSAFKEMSGNYFDKISYSDMIEKHSGLVTGLPTKDIIGKALFQDDNFRIIDANSIQNNCGFDFLVIGPDQKGSIIDLKSHHVKSTAPFNTNKISTSSMHFLNSILKVVYNNEEYKDLQFNSIGLFKISWEIFSKSINIKDFELRYDDVDSFKNNLPNGTNKSLDLSNNFKKINLKDTTSQNIHVNQLYREINVREAYKEMFDDFISSIKNYFKFDNDKNIIISSEPIVLNTTHEKNNFVEVLKTIFSSTEIKTYPETAIFKDENKIKLIKEFIINKEKVKYDPDDINDKNKKTKQVRYFYNSTLTITVLNSLNLNAKSSSIFKKILHTASLIKDDGGTRAYLKVKDANKHRKSLLSLINNIDVSS